MKLKFVSALALTVMVSACAPVTGNSTQTAANATDAASRQCFHSDQVRDFIAPKRDTLHLQVDGNRTFEVEAFGPCNDLDDAYGIALMPDRGMGRLLCTGDTARVLTRGGVEPRGLCRIRVTKQVVADAAKEASETQPAA